MLAVVPMLLRAVCWGDVCSQRLKAQHVTLHAGGCGTLCEIGGGTMGLQQGHCFLLYYSMLALRGMHLLFPDL